MEPRCEHRGEFRAGELDCLWSVLQWSRGANTAESGQARGAHVDAQTASMEPRCEHRGEQWYLPELPDLASASMEPRCEHRGESRGGRAMWVYVRDASMEPRCEHRGEEVQKSQLSDLDGLQWSRGANTAERSRLTPDVLALLLASMEPRCEHRGEV